MFFEVLALLAAGAGKLVEASGDRGRITQWKQKEYDNWMAWVERRPGTCPPPPLHSTWWDDAIRPDKHCYTQHDGLHFIRCKSAYMDAHKNESTSLPSRSRNTGGRTPGAGDLAG